MSLSSTNAAGVEARRAGECLAEGDRRLSDARVHLKKALEHVEAAEERQRRIGAVASLINARGYAPSAEAHVLARDIAAALGV